jgi:hypothetical protein
MNDFLMKNQVAADIASQLEEEQRAKESAKVQAQISNYKKMLEDRELAQSKLDICKDVETSFMKWFNDWKLEVEKSGSKEEKALLHIPFEEFVQLQMKHPFMTSESTKRAL